MYISAEEDEAFNLNGSLPMLVLDYHFVELFKESYGSCSCRVMTLWLFVPYAKMSNCRFHPESHHP
jgi:hypothetical protein